MTRSEAVAAIQLQLSFRTTLESEIITQLQIAQTMLESGPTKPWWLISEDSYVTVTSGDQRVEVPSDFLEETEQAVLRYVPDTVSASNPEVDLRKDEYDVLRKAYLDTVTGTIETGAPKAYALMGDYFRLFPIPDDEYLIRMIYYKRDTALTSNVENGWLKWNPFVLMGKAGKLIAGGPLRDMAAYNIFDTWEKEGLVKLLSQTTSREVANLPMQMGGRH